MSGHRILCRRPGFRRAGIAHPAVATYAAGELTADQLDAIAREPNLVLMTLSDTAPAEVEIGNGHLVLTELRGAVAAAIASGTSLGALSAIVVGFLAEEWQSLGGPRDTHSEPQQPAEPAGQKAEPEAVPVVGIDGEAALAPTSGVMPSPEASETGEAAGNGSAAADPAAVTIPDQGEAPANAPAAPAKSTRKGR